VGAVEAHRRTVRSGLAAEAHRRPVRSGLAAAVHRRAVCHRLIGLVGAVEAHLTTVRSGLVVAAEVAVCLGRVRLGPVGLRRLAVL